MFGRKISGFLKVLRVSEFQNIFCDSPCHTYFNILSYGIRKLKKGFYTQKKRLTVSSAQLSVAILRNYPANDKIFTEDNMICISAAVDDAFTLAEHH